MRFPYPWILSALLWSSYGAAETQQFASLGDLNLTSGDVIKDCQIAYRTYGKLNSKKDNVVVMPTWHTGSTLDLERYELVGPNKLLDTNQYFIITIDALGNGVSTSPSNSKHQSGNDYPQVSIADMVYSQYRLLTEKLEIQSVHAVIGISMGGMQTFQWIRQYPTFMKKAVAIDGSPYLTSYDVIQWQTHLDVIRVLQDSDHSNSEIAAVLSPLNLLTLWTPDYFVENVAREDLHNYLEQSAEGYENFDGNNYIAQTQAMIDHNAFEDGTERYSANLRNIATDLLVVVVPDDHMVNPTPARLLATSTDAAFVEIDSNCGHMGTTCEDAAVARQVSAFLLRK
jgi:homoserine O-acetyltransferase